MDHVSVIEQRSQGHMTTNGHASNNTLMADWQCIIVSFAGITRFLDLESTTPNHGN